MQVNVKFTESNSTFNAGFNEENEALGVGFSALLVVGNGSGENGATFIPSVASDGVISWTNDKGLPNPTPVNIKGDKGDRGEQGLRGADGAKGDKGEKGDKGDTGEAGATGANGKNGYSFFTTDVALTPIAELDFLCDENNINNLDGRSIQIGDFVLDTTSGMLTQVGWYDPDNGYLVRFVASLKGDKGEAGATGANGKDGADGYTPEKGKDYFTDADKSEMVSAVIAALPVYNGEAVSV